MLGPETIPDYADSQEDRVHHHAHAGTLEGHDGPVLSVRFTRDGSYCLSTGKVCIVGTHWSSDQRLLITHSQLPLCIYRIRLLGYGIHRHR